MNQSKEAVDYARMCKQYFTLKYNVQETSIVWIGGNNFIICKNGEEIHATF